MKCIHKNRGLAPFASRANRTLAFFQWSLAFLIFTWKENNVMQFPNTVQELQPIRVPSCKEMQGMTSLGTGGAGGQGEPSEESCACTHCTG